MNYYHFTRAYDGGWDIWDCGRLVAEDFDSLDEAIAWLEENKGV